MSVGYDEQDCWQSAKLCKLLKGRHVRWNIGRLQPVKFRWSLARLQITMRREERYLRGSIGPLWLEFVCMVSSRQQVEDLIRAFENVARLIIVIYS